MMMGEPSGFEAWFQEFIFYAGPIMQMVYWLVMAVAAVGAVLLFKRWVDCATGGGRDARDATASEAAAEPVPIDEFVE